MFVGLPLALWAAEARTMCFRFLVDLRKNTPDPKSGSDVIGGKHRLCLILQEPSRAMVFHYLRWSDYVDQGFTRQPPARSPATGDILSRVGLVVRLSCSALRHSFTPSTAQGEIDALHDYAQRGAMRKAAQFVKTVI